MLAVIARMVIRGGQEAAFETLAKAMAAQVRSKEPGCKLYQLCKGPGAGEYVLIERYTDADAFAAHGNTPYFKAAMPQLGPLLAGQPVIEILNEVD